MSETQYNHRFIEHKWQQNWRKHKTFEVPNGNEAGGRPKFYVLDMFPYPSGAGLHVGHPLGYIASDIVTRFKRHKGFNVLHPMGYDAFGLPAEQYAIQTGKHPAETTEENIKRYRHQLDRIGFAFDWSREVRTCDPAYYKWTQWIFKQLFDHWYNQQANKAEHIDNLLAIFENEGNVNVRHHGPEVESFIAEEWLDFNADQKENILQNYRLAFLSEASVNWCEALGTVLANDEIRDGLSERGGHPVTKKTMRQWSMRITAYSQRLLDGLEDLEWSESIKEIQRNWIGRSDGALVHFNIEARPGLLNRKLSIFTTRPDTIFGATFMVVAPEHELATKLLTNQYREEAEAYITWAKNRSERDRMSDVKTVTGVHTGTFCIHPFSGKKMPILIADYVLGGYGTGAIMAVPAHDSRDHAFAKKFKLDIIQVVENEEVDVQKASYDAKDGMCINSDFLNGLRVKKAIQRAIFEIDSKMLGEGQTNYKLRDAVFGRQRYWGEPIPVIFKNDLPTVLKENELPLELPEVESYKPTGDGASPLAGVEAWVNTEKGRRETDTMPGWAGSSWYFLRYMDPHNNAAFASKDALNYWGQVDLYVGGAEHATGHLLYSRFWNKFLYDINAIPFDEPFKKMVNQGMIQGIIESALLKKDSPEGAKQFVCASLIKEADLDQYTAIPVLVDYVSDYTKTDSPSFLNSEGIHQFTDWMPDYLGAEFVCSNGSFKAGSFTPNKDSDVRGPIFFTKSETGKMSKSKYNVVNPDDVCEEYGADSLRLYEMFLGPLEDAKPWNISGIDGVYRFLRKVWKLYIDQDGNPALNNDPASKASLKTLHATIKKISEDIEKMSLNTCVSTFMIAINEFQSQNCNNRQVLEDYLVLLSPFAPHISEELWEAIGHNQTIADANWPKFDANYLLEDSKVYPISINGKTRAQLELSLSLSKEEIEQAALANEMVIKWLEGKLPKKVIVVPGRIINIVI
ncbi:MAG: leucyl-tRNA synthetase [Bacteroidia bacterium]|jgi:leucyl-tRNA synthetase